MPNVRTIRWLDAPEATNYPAALSYLTLVFESKRAKTLVKQLGEEKTIEFKAKDIFRASGLSLLGVSNYHVERDLKKIRSGKALSPLLLVRVPEIAKVIVADGYHRLCAVYTLDEDAVIPCRIA
jgi:hypothetical protein